MDCEFTLSPLFFYSTAEVCSSPDHLTHVHFLFDLKGLSEHLLLLQSAQFPFPALTSGGAQLWVTPVAGHLKPASMRRQRRAGPTLELPDQQASQTG